MPGTTTLTLIALTLATVAAEAWAVWRWRYATHLDRGTSDQPNAQANPATPLWGPATVVGLVGVGTLITLAVVSLEQGAWQPLASHLHGLLWMCVLLALAIVFLRWRTGLTGLPMLATPVLAFFLLWAVCASWWTYRLFDLESVTLAWSWAHLAGVYAGTAAAVIAAAFGVAYLWAERAARHTASGPRRLGLGSLERLERWVGEAATLGFVLLTIGLVSGVVILSQTPGSIGGGAWGWLKVALAASAWLAYAVAMVSRRSAVLRGSRAAWIAIGGLVLLIVVYGVVVSLPGSTTNAQAATPETTPATPTTEPTATQRSAP